MWERLLLLLFPLLTFLPSSLLSSRASFLPKHHDGLKQTSARLEIPNIQQLLHKRVSQPILCNEGKAVDESPKNLWRRKRCAWKCQQGLVLPRWCIRKLLIKPPANFCFGTLFASFLLESWRLLEAATGAGLISRRRPAFNSAGKGKSVLLCLRKAPSRFVAAFDREFLFRVNLISTVIKGNLSRSIPLTR